MRGCVGSCCAQVDSLWHCVLSGFGNGGGERRRRGGVGVRGVELISAHPHVVPETWSRREEFLLIGSSASVIFVLLVLGVLTVFCL
ncbi:hypothetical protein chiPu_0029504, partial [Chiloscyllium punctatum]|nr:hypothetical protein [Chiloscyllium punctatum]